MVQSLTKLMKNLVDNPKEKYQSLNQQFEQAEKNVYKNVVRSINALRVVKTDDIDRNEDLTSLGPCTLDLNLSLVSPSVYKW